MKIITRRQHKIVGVLNKSFAQTVAAVKRHESADDKIMLNMPSNTGM